MLISHKVLHQRTEGSMDVGKQRQWRRRGLGSHAVPKRVRHSVFSYDVSTLCRLWALRSSWLSFLCPDISTRAAACLRACARSDWFQRLVRLRGQLHAYGIGWPHLAVSHHHTHHASLADEIALHIAVQYRGHQAGLETVELGTGVA